MDPLSLHWCKRKPKETKEPHFYSLVDESSLCFLSLAHFLMVMVLIWKWIWAWRRGRACTLAVDHHEWLFEGIVPMHNNKSIERQIQWASLFRTKRKRKKKGSHYLFSWELMLFGFIHQCLFLLFLFFF